MKFTKDKVLQAVGGFIKAWGEDNIFDSRKWDMLAYFIVYLLLPITTATISLLSLKTGAIEKAYCYWSILINAVGCLYDAASRKSQVKSVKNLKVYMIIGATLVVLIYCVINLVDVLMSTNIVPRCDDFMWAYLVVVAIWLIDAFIGIGKDIAFTKCVREMEVGA